ncbi:MAG: sn-glycerol-3-phosphate ABC transporter substrate-binding protein UgpB [Neisseriaceae bacterium]|nr:MAG: sn-glycerol-3-phosphate ABC transporter substrate-binding protein UgpB [Neisseriaceae bacterium]
MFLKKIKLGVVLFSSLAALYACGDGGKSSNNEIVFWHSFSGGLGNELNAIIDDFNQANPDIKVKAINKGSYDDALNAGIAAVRSNNAPDILQVFEVGTATMMYSGNIIKPVSQLMEEVGIPFNSSDFVDAVAAYYSDNNGRLVSMPFNSSTAVFYYNKDAFRNIGLDPNRPPKTFEEVQEIAKQLVTNKNSGVNCGVTVTWPAWILLETGSARNNTPYANKNNGFGGIDARISFDYPYYVRILTDLSEMSKDRSFVYGGRGDRANELFTTEQCAMLLDSSGNYSDIKANSKFSFGVATIPYYASIEGAPQTGIIGGASLWVFNGKSEAKYRSIAKFLKYLSSPKVMAQWHQKTGYVPVTKAAYALTKEQGYYDSNPDAEVPIQYLNSNPNGKKLGIRLGNLPAIRDIEQAEMEKVFDYKLTPQEALSHMQEKANKKLEEFEKNHQSF